MKIYHEQDNSIQEINDTCDAVESVVPPELFKIISPLLSLLKKTSEEKLFHFYEKEKYRLMWTLRHLEPEIDAEGGMFIIQADGSLLLKEFSPELSDKIRDILATGN